MHDAELQPTNATDGSQALTPDLLSALIRFQKVSQPLCVRGRATDVNIWKKESTRRCYGKLKHSDDSLPFWIASEPFPVEEEDALSVAERHRRATATTLRLGLFAQPTPVANNQRNNHGIAICQRRSSRLAKLAAVKDRVAR